MSHRDLLDCPSANLPPLRRFGRSGCDVMPRYLTPDAGGLLDHDGPLINMDVRSRPLTSSDTTANYLDQGVTTSRCTVYPLAGDDWRSCRTVFPGKRPGHFSGSSRHGDLQHRDLWSSLDGEVKVGAWSLTESRASRDVVLAWPRARNFTVARLEKLASSTPDWRVEADGRHKS